MTPKYGGDPLPLAPDCLPGDTRTAALYLAMLTQALTQPGWSRVQRRMIRDKARRWMIRSEGRDEHFQAHGTFPPGMVPGYTDLVVARWRKLYPRSKAERKKRTVPKRRFYLVKPHDP